MENLLNPGQIAKLKIALPNKVADRCSFAVKTGWYDLLHTTLLCIAQKVCHHANMISLKNKMALRTVVPPSWLEQYLTENPTDPFENFYIKDISNEFGRLVIAVEGNTSQEVQGILYLCKAMSARLCIECGYPGHHVKTDDGVNPLCRKHEMETKSPKIAPN